jgi:hypothetical protein
VHGVGNVGYLTGITAVAAGAAHTIALKTDGTVYAWGYNNYGQLGDDTTSDKYTPVQVLDGTNGTKPFVIEGIFDCQTSLINYAGIGASYVASATYYDVIFDNVAATFTLDGSITALNDLTITSGTLDADGKAITVGGNWNNAGGIFVHGDAGTVIFNGTGAHNITSSGSPFYNVTFNNAAGTWKLLDMFDADNNLRIASGTLDANGKNIYVGGNWNNAGGAYIHNNNLVTFDGDSLQNITSGGSSFRDITILNISLGGVAFMDSATCDTLNTIVGVEKLTFASGSTCTVTNTINIGGAAGNLLELVSDTPGIAWNLNAPATTLSYISVTDSDASSGGLMTADKSSNGGNNTHWSFGDILFLGTGTWSDPASWSTGILPGINDNVSIQGTCLLNATPGQVNAIIIETGYSLELAGYNIVATTNITNNGTLILQGDETITGTLINNTNSTVIYNGAVDANIPGSMTYYNLTCETAGKKLIFAAGSTQTITGALTLKGAAGNLIILVSSVDGTQWNIDPQGTYELSYLDIKDSNNISGKPLDPANSIDSGNNTNWWTPQVAYVGNEIKPPVPPEVYLPLPDIDANYPLIYGLEMFLSEMSGMDIVNTGLMYDETIRLKKNYAPGKYRTVVIVYEGTVVNVPYDEKGMIKGKARIMRAGDKSRFEFHKLSLKSRNPVR